MLSDARLERLLSEWETACNQGRPVAVAELCRDCPELLNALEDRIRAQRTPHGALPPTISDLPLPSSDSATRIETAAPVEPAPSTLLDYRIDRELGRGGMGIVFEAFDLKRQRKVALKTLQHMSPDALFRFKQEFRVLANVAHPNLVTLYELISHGGSWFLAMELLDGTDFLTYVRTREPAPNEEAATLVAPESQEAATASSAGGRGTKAALTTGLFGRLRDALRQLAEGVAALHEAGVLHRDIKPTNVLVTKDGRVLLLDFGLAANLATPDGAVDELGMVVGTKGYMAPEQARGKALTPASDWYSVGIMLFKALTGQSPGHGQGYGLFLDEASLVPQAPREVAANVPDDLNRLCVALLQPWPEDRPSREEILRCLRNEAEGPAPTPIAPSARGLLVGRETELAALEDAFATAQMGWAVTVLVCGRSGFGKSALVQSFLDRLRERGQAAVLVGRCFEQESMPFKALDSLVDALALYLARLPWDEAESLLPPNIRALARVFPVLRRVGAVAEAPARTTETPDRLELRRQAFAALRELLARLGKQRPLVLVIDDLHWGDTDSAHLLADLLRPPDAPGLLLCGTYRSEARESSAFLQTLFGLRRKFKFAHEWREIEIGVLAPADAERLALALLPAESQGTPAAARLIARESGGNPLFVSALAHHLRGTHADQHPVVGELSLDEVLGARIARLSGDAQRLLEILAVAGRPLREADACEAARLSGESRTMLHHLRGAHLVRGTGPRVEDDLEIFHDRLREVISARLSAEARKDCHGQLAITLEASGQADPETLAIHFRHCDQPAKAGRYFAEAAARASETLAFDRAAQLCRQALSFQAGNSTQEQGLRIRLADALANAGRGAEAAREYQTAARGTQGAEELDLQRRAAYYYCSSGRLEEGKAALEAVLRRVGMRLPPTPLRALLSLLLGRARLWLRGIGFRERDPASIPIEDLNRIDVAWSATAGLSMFDVVAGADFQTRNLLLSLGAGEPYRVVRALAWQAAHTSNRGARAWPHTVKLLQAAQTLAQRIEHPHALGITTLSAGVADFTRGHWATACSQLEAAEKILRERCTGVAWELGTAHTFSLWSRFYLGDVAEMGRRSARLLKEARERGDLYAVTTLGTFAEAITRLAADAPDEARRTVTDYLHQWSQKGFHVQHMIALMTHTYIDLYCGDGTAAWERINDEWPALHGSRLLVVQVIRALMTNLRARSALAAATTATHSEPLLRSAERYARQLRREKTVYSEPLACAIDAGVAAQRGKLARSLELFPTAIAGFDAANMPLFAAAVRCRLGEMCGGAEGRNLQENGWAEIARQDIRSPARWVQALAPAIGASRL